VSSTDGPYSALNKAFDELRFGPRRTLNLRAQQPTALQAEQHAEMWLRSQQVEGAAEVLIITGRGNRSVEGVSPVREAVAKLLPSLRRRNVIQSFVEHTPGSFAVTLAPVRALFEAPRRRRERGPMAELPLPETLAALDEETQVQLRELALVSLEALGVRSPTHTQIEDEMQRQFAALASSIVDNDDREALLQQAMMRAKEEYDNAV
jgi:hypothetical protein